jgi:hypothetical protein
MVPGLYLLPVFWLGRLILVYHPPRPWPASTASCLLFESDNGRFRIRLSLCSPRAGVPSRLPSGVDLTFAIEAAASSVSECEIQNSTGNLYLPVVL